MRRFKRWRALLAAALLWALAPLAPARADDWTATDTTLQLTVITLQIVDWGQTQRAIRYGYAREINPLLGAHPTEDRLRLTVGAAIVGHALVSYLLPQPYRMIWQCVWIGVEGGTIWANYRLTGGLLLSW